jgi:catechol 2,3-dioxygenase-like lactoylglutathione lyase family enzyme
MAVHRLTTITVGVPDVDATAAFYREFGLDDLGDGRFATTDGGEQLRLVPAARRGLQELGIGADDPDDLDRLASSLAAIGAIAERDDDSLRTEDPTTGTAVSVTVAPRVEVAATDALVYNAPGRIERSARAGRARPVPAPHVVDGRRRR